MRRAALPSLLMLPPLLAGCARKAGRGGDDTPPEVSSTIPASGATASVTVVVTATFSEDMDEDTITAQTFRLTSGGTPVLGTVAVAGETATLTPSAPLAPGATYLAQVTGDATDLAGNALEAAYSWSFTTSSGELVLSSAALPPGGTFEVPHTCDGVNVSPPLSWTAGPSGTMSYAIVFRDLTFPLIHWVLWDIPLGTTSLDQGVPTDALPNPPGGGAKQVLSYDNATYGYLGPCPGGSLHTYEFVVYAVDVAALPGVTTSSTRTQVETEILLHELGSASLQGHSDAG